MAHFVPVSKTSSSSDLAQLIIDWVIRLHGIPKGITSDRGGQFNSKFWSEVSRELNIKLHLSTAFHPQTDGQTEVTNKAVEKHLRAYCNYQQDNWDELLSMAEFSYNNAYHTAIKTTPFYANIGRHPSFDLKQQISHFKVPAARKLVANMTSVWKWIRHNICTANKKYAEYANLKRKDMPTKVKVGDKVWLNSKNIKTQRLSAKLDHKFLGPFKVMAVANHGLNL